VGLNGGHLTLTPVVLSCTLAHTQCSLSLACSLALWLCLFPSLSFCELVIHPLCESGRVGIWKTAVPVTLYQFTFSFPYPISLSLPLSLCVSVFLSLCCCFSLLLPPLPAPSALIAYEEALPCCEKGVTFAFDDLRGEF